MHAGFATSNHGSSLTHTPVRVSYLSSAVVRRCNYHVPLSSCSAKETVKGPPQIASGCYTIPDHSCFNLAPATSVLLYTRNTCDLCAEDKSLWVNTALWSHQAVSYILSLSLSLYRRIIIILRQMANHKFVRVAAPLGVCLSALLSLL